MMDDRIHRDFSSRGGGEFLETFSNLCVGHGWDVRCVEWHPQKSLLVSGSKDNFMKLWDPKSGTNIATM